MYFPGYRFCRMFFSSFFFFLALIQLMAAAVAKRDVCYFTFGDDRLTEELYQVHELLRRNSATISMYLFYHCDTLSPT